MNLKISLLCGIVASVLFLSASWRLNVTGGWFVGVCFGMPVGA